MQRKGDTDFNVFHVKNVPLKCKCEEVKEQMKEFLLSKI